MIKMLDNSNFESVIGQKDKLIIIDFFAQWCMPCKMFSPVFDKVSEQHTEVEFYKLDIDLNEEFVNRYQIDSVPTILFIRNGIVIDQEIGTLSEKEMNDLIQKHNN